MNRTVLLAASAMLALVAGNALAGGSGVVATGTAARPSGEKILYNQNKNHGYTIISQNFTSGSFGTSYNAVAADDFVVPAGAIWKVTRVDVAGQYFQGAGPAKSEVITFYKNDKGRPGIVIGHAQTLTCADTAGSFACTIQAVTLKGGANGNRYWLSVVANCDYNKCGEWGWVQNTATHKDPGQWENPAGGLGLGCTSWSDTSSCGMQTGGADDFAFDLRGKSN